MRCSVINAGAGSHEQSRPRRFARRRSPCRRKHRAHCPATVAICGEISCNSRVARSNMILLGRPSGARVRPRRTQSVALPAGNRASSGFEKTVLRHGAWARRGRNIVNDMLAPPVGKAQKRLLPCLGGRSIFRYYEARPAKSSPSTPADAHGVMHPGPHESRRLRSHPDVADVAQSPDREQVEMGVAVRMAVLEALAMHLPGKA